MYAVVSALPDGDPAPADGSLPPSALAGLGERPFGVYVHVPFCATRCGYCDFNTYTPGELGTSASPVTWLEAVRAELELAASVLGSPPAADTVFVGGGTPSLLGADGLAAVRDAVRATFGLAAGAEITTEANPESTSPLFFAGIAEAGFTRVSLGMQSAAPRVLAVLDRRHTPGRAFTAAREASAAGLEHVSLDLIYGTPGETDDDLRASLDAAVSAGVDHVSAYALIVEDGTALASRIRRGQLAAPDDDVLAVRYELVDRTLRACTGTRCPTGPGPRPPGASTTSATGSAPTGGVSAPARTPTSAASAGGTSSTPLATRPCWGSGAPRPPRARCSPTSSA
jgi:coproporphyrinogen III oxidase-like Fe-S oxidoreductase